MSRQFPLGSVLNNGSKVLLKTWQRKRKINYLFFLLEPKPKQRFKGRSVVFLGLQQQARNGPFCMTTTIDFLFPCSLFSHDSETSKVLLKINSRRAMSIQISELSFIQIHSSLGCHSHCCKSSSFVQKFKRWNCYIFGLFHPKSGFFEMQNIYFDNWNSPLEL